MKHFFATLFLLFCMELNAQDSATAELIDTNPENLYPTGATISIGGIVSNNVGFDFRSSVLLGKGRVKIGYNMGYTIMHFKDTLKQNKLTSETQSRAIGGLGFGVASRVYTQSGVAYFNTAANYLIAFDDGRFGATNGVSLKMGIGFFPNRTEASIIAIEAGVIGTAYTTNTNERPANLGFVLGVCAMF